MTKEQACLIAQELVTQSGIDQCHLESARRQRRCEDDADIRYEWVIVFAFEQDSDITCANEIAIVLVDDASGRAEFLETL